MIVAVRTAPSRRPGQFQEFRFDCGPGGGAGIGEHHQPGGLVGQQGLAVAIRDDHRGSQFAVGDTPFQFSGAQEAFVDQTQHVRFCQQVVQGGADPAVVLVQEADRQA